MPKKVEQINDYLFIDTYKSNKIKIGMIEMRVNDSEMRSPLILLVSSVCKVGSGNLQSFLTKLNTRLTHTHKQHVIT
jgi:hypothetical protein